MKQNNKSNEPNPKTVEGISNTDIILIGIILISYAKVVYISQGNPIWIVLIGLVSFWVGDIIERISNNKKNKDETK